MDAACTYLLGKKKASQGHYMGYKGMYRLKGFQFHNIYSGHHTIIHWVSTCFFLYRVLHFLDNPMILYFRGICIIVILMTLEASNALFAVAMQRHLPQLARSHDTYKPQDGKTPSPSTAKTANSDLAASPIPTGGGSTNQGSALMPISTIMLVTGTSTEAALDPHADIDKNNKMCTKTP